jgi:hypothetical protein
VGSSFPHSKLRRLAEESWLRYGPLAEVIAREESWTRPVARGTYIEAPLIVSRFVTRANIGRAGSSGKSIFQTFSHQNNSD